MRKITLLIIIIASMFLMGSRPSFEGADYRIYVEKSDKDIVYRADDFYSVYYVYMNVIRALDVNDRLGERDIEKIITAIISNLKKSKAVQLQVDKYKGPGGILRVTVRPEIAPKGGKPILLIVSNYNVQAKQVVSGDDQKDAYGTFFYLSGNKLVKNRYVHEQKSDAELKKMTVNNRADYYLLDGDAGNDAAGKDLLVKEIEKTKDQRDLAVLYMTLSEYNLLAGNVGSAKECLGKARAIISALKDEKAKAGLSNVLKYADDVYTYYVKYTGRS